MRLRIGAAMPEKGGRTALVGTEVLERRAADGRLEHRYFVGRVDRVTPYSVEAARDRIVQNLTALADLRPCVLVDVATPQGLALRQGLVGAYSRDLHRPHAYQAGKGLLFATFLKAYSDGHVEFAPNLGFRSDLDRALVFYSGGGVKRDGVELDSEDEAMVVALGLSLFWPKHGPAARPVS